MSGPVVTVRRDFAAPPERVFDAWLDPQRARQFLFATPDGEMQRVEIDARVGGAFTVVERRAGGDAAHHGLFVEIARPSRIVFRFSADPEVPPERGTLVTIEIAPTPTGCTLTLTHQLDPEWSDFADRAEAGWTMMLVALAKTMEISQ